MEADYQDGVLKPRTPLRLRPGERVQIIVVRRPDPARWNLEKLSRGGREDEELAGAGLDEWSTALDDEDRG